MTTIGISVGLPAEEISSMLQSDEYVQEVKQEQYIAHQIGVQGVPFFVFNNKYAVLGAQPSEVFGQVLNKVWEEEKPLLNVSDKGASCTVDGDCS